MSSTLLHCKMHLSREFRLKDVVFKTVKDVLFERIFLDVNELLHILNSYFSSTAISPLYK